MSCLVSNALKPHEYFVGGEEINSNASHHSSSYQLVVTSVVCNDVSVSGGTLFHDSEEESDPLNSAPCVLCASPKKLDLSLFGKITRSIVKNVFSSPEGGDELPSEGSSSSSFSPQLSKYLRGYFEFDRIRSQRNLVIPFSLVRCLR